MTDTPMVLDEQGLKKYLVSLAEQEKNVRAVLADKTSKVGDRAMALRFMDDEIVFSMGFFTALSALFGEQQQERVQYYMEYYDQARSERGLS